jgi:hypothetical protein
MTHHYNFVTGLSPTGGRWHVHDLVRLYAEQLSEEHLQEDNPDHAGHTTELAPVGAVRR